MTQLDRPPFVTRSCARNIRPAPHRISTCSTGPRSRLGASARNTRPAPDRVATRRLRRGGRSVPSQHTPCPDHVVTFVAPSRDPSARSSLHMPCTGPYYNLDSPRFQRLSQHAPCVGPRCDAAGARPRRLPTSPRDTRPRCDMVTDVLGDASLALATRAPRRTALRLRRDHPHC